MRNSSLPELPVSDFESDVERLRAEILAEDEAEAKAAFYLRLRAHGVQDLAVLRALELVPRQIFVPQRYLDLTSRDLALPVECGQTLDQPWLIGRMIEALGVKSDQRVLQIGAGTGYATAIMSHLAREVVAVERYQSLVATAQARLVALDIANARIAWEDGLSLSPDVGQFARVLVHGLLTDLPQSVTARLAQDGILVAARPTTTGQAVMQITRAGAGFVETPVCPCRLRPLVPGLAAAL